MKPRKPHRDPAIALRIIGKARARQSAEPLAADQLRDLGIGFHGALEALRTGRGSWDDINTLALAANVSIVLCDAGFGADEVETVKASQEVIVTLDAKWRTTGRVVLTGEDLRRLQALVELHDAQIGHPECTQGVMVQALDEIKRRMKAGNVAKVAA